MFESRNRAKKGAALSILNKKAERIETASFEFRQMDG